jgi:hypothetical protein
MNRPAAKKPGSGWQRHIFYRKESLRTTWKLRLAVILLPVLVLGGTRGFWSKKISQTLTCVEQSRPSDSLLLENFDPSYLIFERARALQKAGIAERIVVPVSAGKDPETPNAVDKGVAELMARIAHISQFELIPVKEIEPISLNAAIQIRDFFTAERVRSVVVVSPAFRSSRSMLVYSSVFAPAGISVGCVPVFDRTDREWTDTWHGRQETGLQFLKFLYYRFYILL